MTIEPVGAVALLLGLLILFRGPVVGFYILIPSGLLGSCAVLFLTAIGGAPVQPAHLMLGFVILAMFAQPGTADEVWSALAFPREGFWLLLTVLWGTLGAILFPRIFAGAVYVSAINQTGGEGSALLVPLGPTTGNITQSVYFIADLVTFLVCYVFAKNRDNFNVLAQAYFIYCTFNIFFALVDLATFWTNTSFLLDFMRNTTYALHDDTVIAGMKRIVGSFTEASSFGGVTLGTFGFTFRLWLGGVRPALTFTVAMISLILLVMCTATTAYVALPLVLAILYMTSLWRLIRGPVPKTVMAYLIFAPLLFVLISAAVMLIPAVGDQVWAIANEMLFNKATSQSAEERGSWNKASIETFFATYGLGGGIGAVRSSSFLLAVFGNLGVIGCVTYGLFLFLILFRRSRKPLDWYVHEVRAAARTTCLANIITCAISASLIDLGLSFFMLAGLACAANDTSNVPAKQQDEEDVPNLLRAGTPS
ncbi:hypothetical protein ACMDCR_19580 [Labrys okinawensis]|uniref:hypothetical protein n=1 Tax=Labrys okinawensis TaxID=346911 RepID=UPI0039BCE52A